MWAQSCPIWPPPGRLKLGVVGPNPVPAEVQTRVLEESFGSLVLKL